MNAKPTRGQAADEHIRAFVAARDTVVPAALLANPEGLRASVRAYRDAYNVPHDQRHSWTRLGGLMVELAARWPDDAVVLAKELLGVDPAVATFLVGGMNSDEAESILLTVGESNDGWARLTAIVEMRRHLHNPAIRAYLEEASHDPNRSVSDMARLSLDGPASIPE